MVNEQVESVYDALGKLLEQGDDVFVEQGPALLQSAIEDPAFFAGVETEHAAPGTYTRNKVIGDDDHVIRFMEWPPGYRLIPHEHHGRPCFEVLIEGELVVTDYDVAAVDELYRLTATDTSIVAPGETSVVDPRVGEVHAVYSPVRSRSLHVYPEDNAAGYGYVLQDDTDLYARERFELRHE